MPRRPTRSVPVVILHGWQGSPPPHWQAWLAEQLREAGREVRFPELPDKDNPRLDRWLAALALTLAELPEAGFDVVAHSLGSLLWLHHAVAMAGTDAPLAVPTAPRATIDQSVPRPARVALVAPVSPRTAIPELASFVPIPLDIDAVRRAAEGTVLVAGDADPYTPEGIADAYARPLKIAATVLPGAGHINVESGFGPWPQILDWCNRDSLAFY
jgi:serine hydrolase